MFLLWSCFTVNAQKRIVKFANNTIVAHRGAWKSKGLPENSIASLRHAIELGCTGAEFDVHMTADDSLVVNHNDDFYKLQIEKSKYADLIAFTLSNGEKLPTLREYLLAGINKNNTTRLVCEIKPSIISKEKGMIIAEKVAHLAHELNLGKNIVYISFDYEILKRIIEIIPSAQTQYLAGDKSPEQVKADKITGIDYHYSVFKLHPEWIENAKRNHILLNAWTVNTADDMDWLIANDFNFITTNEPELLFERINKSPVNNGWKLVWSDEFNYNGLPDSNKWNYEKGGNGWGNNEKQFYLSESIENSFVKNGMLNIVALKKDYEKSLYTSAKLTTYKKFSLQYGKVEVMAKLPSGKGTWPAIWMLPESIMNGKENWPLSGEIDIMEQVGKDPDIVHVSLHSLLYNHVKGTQVTHFDKVPDVSGSFHKYGIEWTQESVSFFIDDKLFYHSAKGENGRVSANEGWPFDKPYYLILNLAIGGNWGGEIDDTIFPSTMLVDFVRIYKK